MTNTVNVAMGKRCWMGSNIHQIPAIQADNNYFGAGMSLVNMFTVGEHTIEGIRVDNNLSINVGMILRDNSPRKHVNSISRSRKHP